MKINVIQSVRASRTVAKREAEKVLRIMNSELPVISSSKMIRLDRARTTPRFFQYARAIQTRIENLVRKPAWRMTNGDDFYKTFVEATKAQKVGNCADSSKLFNLLGHLNGLRTTKVGMVLGTDKGNYVGKFDHVVHALPVKGELSSQARLSEMKDVLIIDPWLGVAEFGPKYDELIRTAYHKFFRFQDNHRVYISLSEVFEDPAVSNNAIEFFKKKYPQFLIKKGEPLIKHKK